jgi:poly-beta-1,6-N-acetyl-D-glucosamine biosynthesis protein PgaD
MKLPSHIHITPPQGQPLIFTNSLQQSKMNKVGFTTINILVWVFWLYLLRFLITALAWLVSLDWSYQKWVDLGHREEFVLLITQSAPLGIAFCIILFIWARVNIFRFTGKVRRNSKLLPNLEQDCKWINVEPNEISQAREAQAVLCHHDDGGKLIAVQIM